MIPAALRASARGLYADEAACELPDQPRQLAAPPRLHRPVPAHRHQHHRRRTDGQHRLARSDHRPGLR